MGLLKLQSEIKTMRDALIDKIYLKMHQNKNIYFATADFGAPALDKLREAFNGRFINVGIAEQNLVNISAGLALEGAVVYAYAIAPFITMRAYEQIRTNLSMLSQTRKINVNLIGVGAGLSYDVAGPTHHCIEDISIMRVLPNLTVFSPSDWYLAERFIDFSINAQNPKYIRLDGKPLPMIYPDHTEVDLSRGFYEFKNGEKVCLVSTGYMTHRALRSADQLEESGIKIGVLDVFTLKPVNEGLLLDHLIKYECVITIEEAFINKGGLDSLISDILTKNAPYIKLKRLGYKDRYVFNVGSRDYLNKLINLDEESIIRVVKKCL